MVEPSDIISGFEFSLQPVIKKISEKGGEGCFEKAREEFLLKENWQFSDFQHTFTFTTTTTIPETAPTKPWKVDTPWAAHLDALCKERGVTIRNLPAWRPISSSAGDALDKFIEIRQVDELRKYWVGLHELGHVANGDIRPYGITHREVVAQEVKAWNWAFKNTAFPADHTVEKLIAEALRGYIFQSGPIWVAEVLDPQDQCWAMAKCGPQDGLPGFRDSFWSS